MFKLAILILSAMLVTVSTADLTTKNHIAARADSSLATFLLQRPRATASSTSMACFGIYLPVLQASSDQWAEEYQDCLDTSQNATDLVLEEASQEQKDLSTDAASVCSYIKSCDAINDVLTSIDCFSTLTTNTLSTIYAVSNNASDAASIIRQRLSNIEIDQYRCTNATERAYFERSARIYDALDECLLYGPPPTVPPPSTTTIAPSTNALPEFEDFNLSPETERARSSKPTDLNTLLNTWLKQNNDVANNEKANVKK